MRSSRHGHNTAILVFVRQAADEQRAKAWVKAGRAGERLSHALNRRVVNMARASGLPVVVADGKAQRGNNFGERFTAAFEQVFAQGYDRIIAIGNDCLSLRVADLHQAHRLLHQHALVLGPDLTGGAYLVGVQRQAYQRQAWLGIAWQTERVLSELRTLATQYNGGLALLRAAADADSGAAIRAAWQNLPYDHLLVGALAAWLSGPTPPPTSAPSCPAAPLVSDHRRGRAPPVA